MMESLEPRLLMSADPVVVDLSALQPAQQNHDVLVRVLDQASALCASARPISTSRRVSP